MTIRTSRDKNCQDDGDLSYAEPSNEAGDTLESEESMHEGRDRWDSTGQDGESDSNKVESDKGNDHIETTGMGMLAGGCILTDKNLQYHLQCVNLRYCPLGWVCEACGAPERHPAKKR